MNREDTDEYRTGLLDMRDSTQIPPGTSYRSSPAGKLTESEFEMYGNGMLLHPSTEVITRGFAQRSPDLVFIIFYLEAD